MISLLLTTACVYSQLLYQVSSKQTRSKSYIFATNKLAPISLIDSVENIYKVYSKCDVLITEMKLNDSISSTLLSYAVLPDSVNLHQIYSIDEYSQINQQIFLVLKQPLDQLASIRPAYLTQLYRNQLLADRLNYDPNESLENFFQTVAQQQGKSIIALDSPFETLHYTFHREPEYYQNQELLRITRFPEREIELEEHLLKLYRQGNLLDMAYYITRPDNQSTFSFSDYQVLAKRNTTWVKRLTPYINSGNAFICVDACLLGGDKGLLAALRAAGFRVRAVNRR